MSGITRLQTASPVPGGLCLREGKGPRAGKGNEATLPPGGASFVSILARRAEGKNLLGGAAPASRYRAAAFNSQCSPKKSAATTPPGARDETGTLTSITAQSGSFGTWRALFR